MSTPYLAEVRMFGGNFAPQGWAFCNGQLLSISENAALFSLVGTTYGGNGTTTFALPNFQGSFPMHWGTGAGAAAGMSIVAGEAGGSTTVSVFTSNLPTHSHEFVASTGPATVPDPTGANLSTPLLNSAPLYNGSAPNVSLFGGAVGFTGNGSAFGRAQPYLAVSFIIALEGVFPSRN